MAQLKTLQQEKRTQRTAPIRKDDGELRDSDLISYLELSKELTPKKLVWLRKEIKSLDQERRTISRNLSTYQLMKNPKFKRGRLKNLKERKDSISARLNRLKTGEEIHSLSDSRRQLKIGQIGCFDPNTSDMDGYIRIFQVVDDSNVMVNVLYNMKGPFRSRNTSEMGPFWLSNYPTVGLIDGARIISDHPNPISGVFFVTGTKQYQTSVGGSKAHPWSIYPDMSDQLQADAA